MAKVVLIIDDSDMDAESIRLALIEAGVQSQIIEVDSGAGGVSLAKLQGGDMIALIDVDMPGMDGFETCKKLKAVHGDQLKAIVMTGTLDTVTVVKAKKAGADDFCLKSPDQTPLIRAVKNLL